MVWEVIQWDLKTRHIIGRRKYQDLKIWEFLFWDLVRPHVIITHSTAVTTPSAHYCSSQYNFIWKTKIKHSLFLLKYFQASAGIFWEAEKILFMVYWENWKTLLSETKFIEGYRSRKLNGLFDKKNTFVLFLLSYCPVQWLNYIVDRTIKKLLSSRFVPNCECHRYFIWGPEHSIDDLVNILLTMCNIAQPSM